MKVTQKTIKTMALIIAIVGLYSVYGWARILFDQVHFNAYLAKMNESGILFSPITLRIDSTAILLIQALGAIGSILIIKRKNIGIKLLITAVVLWPIFNALLATFNMVSNREIGLFVINIIWGSIFCYFVVKIFTSTAAKEYLEKVKT